MSFIGGLLCGIILFKKILRVKKKKAEKNFPQATSYGGRVYPSEKYTISE